MPMYYTPKVLLRQVPNALLWEYFIENRKQLRDLPWGRLRETDVEPIHDALLALPEADRREIGGHFRAIAEMAKREFTPWLVRIARERDIDLVKPFRRKSCAYERAFWMFLKHPDVFEEARTLSHWERLPRRSMEKRTGLPPMDPEITPDVLEQFGRAMAEYYQENQGRGDHCKVEHFLRSGHIDFFFAYPADYADVLIGYEDGGNFARREWKPAFEVIISFDRIAGSLDLYAEGTRDVRDELVSIFARTVLKLNFEPPRAAKPPYNLQLLLQPGFQFPTAPEDNVRWVKMRTIRVRKQASVEQILFDVGSGEARRDIHDLIDEALNQMNLPRERLVATQASFQAGFETGRKQPKTVNFTITHPSGCTLRDSDEDLTLRRYLRQWNIAS
ncbi:MAG: hypothetical protein IT165_22635 [Bryobacterales bacterium]|nr:hypothetical protein [Bryobacterales bacterium]